MAQGDDDQVAARRVGLDVGDDAEARAEDSPAVLLEDQQVIEDSTDAGDL